MAAGAGIAAVRKKFAVALCGVRLRRRTVMAAIAALVLLPIEAGNAGWLSDVLKGSSKKINRRRH
jgi:N-acetylmuramoyl-L-alanine amidase